MIKNQRAIAWPIAAFLMVCISAPASAGLWGDIWKGSKTSVGLGPAYIPDYEGSDDYVLTGAPLVNVNWKKGQFLKLGGHTGAASLRWSLVPSKTWSGGPVVQYRRGPFKGPLSAGSVDDDVVDRLSGNGNAIEVGFFVGAKFGQWHGQFQWVIDKGAGHDGALVDLKGGYTMPVNDKLAVTFEGLVTYASTDYMDSYFSINAANAANSGLPQYRARSDLKDFALNVKANYSISKKWSLVGTAGYKRLLGDAEDSPIVNDRGDENQFIAAVLGVYHFD